MKLYEVRQWKRNVDVKVNCHKSKMPSGVVIKISFFVISEEEHAFPSMNWDSLDKSPARRCNILPNCHFAGLRCL